MALRILAAVAVLLVGWIVYEWVTFPDVLIWQDRRPQTTAFMEQRKAALRKAGKDGAIAYEWVPYSQISPNLRRAVLVSEDNEFYEHEGIDVEAMKEALRKGWEQRRITHGGSTITQQLAKNLYLSPARTPWRKFKEILIARSMEQKLTKKRILELYLNVVEMGERVYGAEAAARYYFGKPASALSPREAALLAACLPNPRVMNPAEPNARLRARQRIILSRMRRWGYIAEREVLTQRPKKEAAPAPPPTETIEEPTPVEEPPETDTSTSPEGSPPEEPIPVTPPAETAPPPTETSP